MILIGSMYWMIGVSYIFVMLSAAFIYLPVFFDLQLTSAYEVVWFLNWICRTKSRLFNSIKMSNQNCSHESLQFIENLNLSKNETCQNANKDEPSLLYDFYKFESSKLSFIVCFPLRFLNSIWSSVSQNRLGYLDRQFSLLRW